MAGNTNTLGINKRHTAQCQCTLVNTGSCVDWEYLGITMTRLVNCEDDKAAARQLYVVSILHLLVIQIAVTRYYGGRGIICIYSFRNKKVRAHCVACICFKHKLLHIYLAAACLNGRDNYAAQKHQCNTDTQPFLCLQFHFFHVHFPFSFLFCKI